MLPSHHPPPRENVHGQMNFGNAKNSISFLDIHSENSCFKALKSPAAKKPDLKPWVPLTHSISLLHSVLETLTCSLHVQSTFSIIDNKQYNLKLPFPI